MRRASPTARRSATANPTAASPIWPRTWCARSWPSARCCARAGLSAPEILACGPRQGPAAGRGPGRSRLRRRDRRRRARRPSCGAPPSTRWSQLRGVPVPPALPLPDGTGYTLPRRDRAAFEIEVELLLDWYWPALKGGAGAAERARRVPGAVGARARPPAGAARRLVPARLPLAQPDLAAGARRAWRASASSISRMRSTSTPPSTWSRCCRMRASTVPEALEAELFDHYCARGRRRASRPSTARRFAAAYADFGAQRNTRLLGLWAAAAASGTASRSICSIFRAPGDISRATCARPHLAPLAAWYERHFPPDVRHAKRCRAEARGRM